MLTAMPDAAMRYSYRARDGGELSVTHCASTLTVTASGNQAVVEAVTGVCHSGLANLKKLAEGG